MDNALAVDKRLVRSSFDRAAAGYDAAAVLQHEVCRRMVARLELVKIDPAAVLDAGCGTGNASAALQERFPRAALWSLDIAFAMLDHAKSRSTWWQRVRGRSMRSFFPGVSSAEREV